MGDEVSENSYKNCESGLIDQTGNDEEQLNLCMKNNEHNCLSNIKNNNQNLEPNKTHTGTNGETNLKIKTTSTEIVNNSNLNTTIHDEKESGNARREQVNCSTRRSKRNASKIISQNSINNTELVTGSKNHTKTDDTKCSTTREDSSDCSIPFGSLLINKKKDYDIQINPDVIDRYTNKRMPSPEIESPESKKRRIAIISSQCRLHPSNKKYNQGPVINPPLISPGVLVGYTPAGQRHEVDLNAHRPTWFNSEYSRLQFDSATRINVSRMMHDLKRGDFLPDTLDPNLERQYFREKELIKEDAKRHFENKNISEGNQPNKINKMQFLETERRLTEITEFALVKINDFPAELCVKMREILDEELSPLMFLKHPIIVEVIEKLTKQSINLDVAYFAHALYNKIKLLFDVPNSQTFLEYFNSEVKRLDEQTKDMTMFDLAIMTEEPNKATVTTHSTYGPIEDTPEESEGDWFRFSEEPVKGTSNKHTESESGELKKEPKEEPTKNTLGESEEVFLSYSEEPEKDTSNKPKETESGESKEDPKENTLGESEEDVFGFSEELEKIPINKLVENGSGEPNEEPEEDTSGLPEEDTSGEPEEDTSGESEEDTSGEPEEDTSGESEEDTSGESEEDTSGESEEDTSEEPVEDVSNEHEADTSGDHPEDYFATEEEERIPAEEEWVPLEENVTWEDASIDEIVRHFFEQIEEIEEVSILMREYMLAQGEGSNNERTLDFREE